MFTLAVVHDTIKVLASQLNGDPVAALTHNINAKYANRVLANVGLCVCLFDHVEVSEGHIRHGDGCTYYKSTFRLVVFRPFIGEVLIGRVRSADEHGMRLTMGFFDDIYVTWDGIPQPSAYDQAEAAWFWVWGQEGEETTEMVNGAAAARAFDTPREERLYFEKDDVVRFVVAGEAFNEPEPPGPSKWKPAAAVTAAAGDAATAAGDQVEAAESAKRVAPYKIHASMMQQGTGALTWWVEAEAQEA